MTITNGHVGDWRLPDEQFLANFRLPGPQDKPGHLERLNPFPRDSRIIFDEEKHMYTIDGCITAPRSVTQIIHEYSEEFDAPSAVKTMRNGANWARKKKDYMRHDGTEMSDEEIIAKWNLNGKTQSARGTLLHFQIEQHINGSIVEEPHSPEFKMYLKFREDFMRARGLVPLRTELSLIHCGLRLAGQADLLCTEEGTGDVVIIDWKRSKDVTTQNRRFVRRMKDPLSHLWDTKYSHYCLQLNIYRYVLESEYGLRVGGMYLAIFHPTASGGECVGVPRLEREIALIVEREKSLNGASDPIPGESAPFLGSVPVH